MNNEEKVEKFLKNNYGYITTADFLQLNISKPTIRDFISNGLIEKVSHGLYMSTKQFKDEYYILQKRYPDAIFSYNTALHILNLTNRTPSEIDITVQRNKRVRGEYNVHRVSDNFYNIGIIETMSPNNNPVKVYNAERCICDMLRSEGEFDLELQNRILDYYFHSKDKDIDKLLEYAKIFNIYEKVNTIVGVMMKW
ncbi:MAG: type IV toxin-antitoxin system AbiEi family antitoxin domain-containing protein [Ruminococcus sp.]|nr:type IV toxin-antitoxin system AbiEi family antitoxin domain-containing protein [Ruminococcus sp.]